MRILLLSALLLGLSHSGAWAETDTKSMVGVPAPILSGKTANGPGLMKLNNLMKEFGFKTDEQGKKVEVNGEYVPEIKRNVVVLSFFATTCVPCMREIPTYNRIAASYEGKPVRLIYVNVDTEVSNDEMSRFIAKKKIEVPMMLPNQREAVKQYQVYSLPRIVVINKDGVIAYEFKGFKETLEKDLTDIINKLL